MNVDQRIIIAVWTRMLFIPSMCIPHNDTTHNKVANKLATGKWDTHFKSRMNFRKHDTMYCACCGRKYPLPVATPYFITWDCGNCRGLTDHQQYVMWCFTYGLAGVLKRVSNTDENFHYFIAGLEHLTNTG